MWQVLGGTDLMTDHVWGDRGEWNVEAWGEWAMKHGIWRPRNTHARPGWGIAMSFGIRWQHIGQVVAQAAALGPVATHEGNTNGGQVLGRVRYPDNIIGFIDFDALGQNKPGVTPLTPKEYKIMGMTDSATVPGAKRQRDVKAAGGWRNHRPSVDAFLNPDQTWSIRGMNGAELAQQNTTRLAAFGISEYHLGKLNAPIRTVEPVRDEAGNWNGQIAALADDGGEFTVTIRKLHYK